MKRADRRALVASLAVAIALTGAVLGVTVADETASASVQVGQLYGDPAAAAPFWRRQSYNDCAEMAVADVVGQLTGRQPTEREILAVAENTSSRAHPGPIYTRWQAAGTYNPDVAALLEQYGVHSVTDVSVTTKTGAPSDIELVKQALSRGHKVIVGVNANILWDRSDGDRTTQNHFVVVTGIDTRDNVIHLNDSGIDSGRNERVPLATFLAAWAAAYNVRTIADGMLTPTPVRRAEATALPR